MGGWVGVGVRVHVRGCALFEVISSLLKHIHVIAVKGTSIPARNGMKTLPTFQPECSVFIRMRKTEDSGRSVGKIFDPYPAGTGEPFTSPCFTQYIVM